MKWLKEVGRNIKNGAISAYDIAYATVYLAAFVLALLLFLKVVVAPMAAVLTFIFAFNFTIYAVKNGEAVLSIGGVVLFLISWPATDTLGILPGLAIWVLGVSLWFWAMFRIAMGPKPKRKPTCTC